jgi:hypothetical protein
MQTTNLFANKKDNYLCGRIKKQICYERQTESKTEYVSGSGEDLPRE